MMSARALARFAPKTICRLSTIATRQTTAIARPSTLAQCAPFRSQISAFSTSIIRKAPAGVVDEELSAKLVSEIQFETELKENEPEPASIKDFLENSPFQIVDTPGQEEVSLKRIYGNEKITVTFSIAEISNMDQDQDMFDEDSALGDEELEGGKPEDVEDVEAGDSADHAVPCRLAIVIEKPGKGALNIEAVAQDSGIIVENMYYYDDADVAHSLTADAAHKSQQVYGGPSFNTLDEDLQVLVERYLEERGITTALAVFVPEYMDLKEQREYLAWLNSVKGFIDA